MILLIGIPSEPPLARIQRQCEAQGLRHHVVNQRRFFEYRLAVTVGSGAVTTGLYESGTRLPVDQLTGVYLRLMDDRALPGISDLPEASFEFQASRAWHDSLHEWAEVAPASVMNRPSAMASNASKPYQQQIIMRAGFAAPETLITSDPEEALEFRARHGRIVFKSISGVRSIVSELSDEDVARLDRIRWCPTQFQELVAGRDIRVHTVGSDTVFATSVASEATDYRYTDRQLMPGPELTACELPDDVAERCLALAAALGLEFAGIDLRFCDDGRVVCFEANPSPAFSYYESHTGQPIAVAVARRLAGLA